MSDFVISRATPQEAAYLLELARREGWNPGLDDVRPFYAADPTGFFIGRLRDVNIGGIAAVAYDTTYGFLGLYIVEPPYRGHGWGLTLWHHAMAYLGGRCIGLDGVVAQQANYRRSHFALHHRNVRYGGQPPPQRRRPLTPLHEVPFDQLTTYDAAVFGVARRAFLKEWIAMPRSHALAKMADGRIVGYGVVRPCYEGHKIGPLFADDDAIAADLLAELCRLAEGTVFIDVPEPNRRAIALAQSLALRPCFETARMYNRPPPPQRLDKVFGVTTFELG